ncbi:MAG: outer membrane lipoprotein carrier protein LolA [Chitinophagaceae bacterium]|nr:outer membrane lipoprotein carrier protein LolA [Chitinophagaceae bacterium]
MLKLRLLIVYLCGVVTMQAQYPGFKSVNDLGRFKQLFTSTAENTQTIKSDFVQEKELSMLSEKITSKGRFWFKKNNKVRMEYTEPFQYLMIINQNNIYVKDGQKESRISTRSNKLFQQINAITVDCIQGTVLNNPEYKIKVFENNQSFLIELSPSAKALKEFFKNINIFVSKKDYSVNKLELHEQSGDKTIISYLNKELNTTLPDALFSIK